MIGVWMKMKTNYKQKLYIICNILNTFVYVHAKGDVYKCYKSYGNKYESLKKCVLNFIASNTQVKDINRQEEEMWWKHKSFDASWR